jgi:hypothetical protein
LLVTVKSNEIAELDQVQLNGWLYKNGTSDLLKVKLEDCGKRINQNEQAKSLYLQKANKVYEHLKQKGVPKRKIEFE